MNKKIKIIKKLNDLSEKYDGSWIGGNAHTAFFVSIGSGPWKDQRIFDVQKSSLDWFYKQNVSDLKYLSDTEQKVYPSDWQNKFLFNMIKSLHVNSDMFEALCLHWKISNDWRGSLQDLFYRCGSNKNGSKVLWLFARDYLNIPSFPIDPTIKRALKAHKLPTCPWEMTELCLEAEVNPNILNRKMFLGVNSDWSIYRPHSSVFY